MKGECHIGINTFFGFFNVGFRRIKDSPYCFYCSGLQFYLVLVLPIINFELYPVLRRYVAPWQTHKKGKAAGRIPFSYSILKIEYCLLNPKPFLLVILPEPLFLPGMSVTIRTQGLVKKYGSRVVVNDVSFEVKQGEIVGLLGPNGAGKTTSFYQVVGLVRPEQGKVFLNDQDITSLPMYKRAQMGIGYLPQEPSIFRKLSVEDNIAAILEMTKLNSKQQKDKLESLIKEFRLQHVRKNNGDVLSGGERRRTEIARALAVDPKFILLDEPFAGIDPIAVEDIQAIVARMKYKNIGILITDHNVTETLSICDRAYLLIEGRIFKHGTAEELAQDEDVRRLYLGRNFELKRKDYLHEEAIKAGEDARQQ